MKHVKSGREVSRFPCWEGGVPDHVLSKSRGGVWKENGGVVDADASVIFCCCSPKKVAGGVLSSRHHPCPVSGRRW